MTISKEPLTSQQVDAIRGWLTHPASILFREFLAAKLTIASNDAALARLDAMLRPKNQSNAESSEAHFDAALRIKITLDTINEIAHQESGEYHGIILTPTQS